MRFGKGSVSDCLGHFNDKNGGLGVLRTEERSAVLSPLDGDPGRLAGSSSSRCFGHCGRCPPFPGGRLSFSTQIPGVQGPISSSGSPGGGDSSAAVFRGPGYGHRPAYPATYFGFCVGGAPGSGTCGMLSGWYVCVGTDESSMGLVCQ